MPSTLPPATPSRTGTSIAPASSRRTSARLRERRQVFQDSQSSVVDSSPIRSVATRQRARRAISSSSRRPATDIDRTPPPGNLTEPPASHETWDKIGDVWIWRKAYSKAFETFHSQRWWNETARYRQKYRRMSANPMKWNSNQRTSWSWEFFHEGIDCDSMEPKVVCIGCDSVLKHPGLGDGTKSLAKHLYSIDCQQAAQERGVTVEKIGAARERAVSVLYPILTRYADYSCRPHMPTTIRFRFL